VKVLPPDPTVAIAPGPTGVPKAPPKGFGPIVHSHPDIEKVAKSLLAEAYGARYPFVLGGHSYMARVEPHPPRAGISTWHKGTTVYEASTGSSWPFWALYGAGAAGGLLLITLGVRRLF
jgi:hypothetical protein